ncbi:MAG TPA: rod shape-determining protein MreD [Burkholderiales bacterium]|nr:rod shape-determining protein MreD [Betaproteobacteria bacterium]HQR53174.1 rod shape-determining protein MreD [Burkholderiales bacterium]
MNQARTDKPTEILLPVNPFFVAGTLALAFVLNLLPVSGRALLWRPDFVALFLAYWLIHYPRRLGFLLPWLLGLAMDVAEGALFGQYALGYTALALMATLAHRRILMFDLVSQTIHVLLMLQVVKLIMLLVRMAEGAEFPGWLYFLGPVVAAVLWPVLTVTLVLPQKPKPDADRG